MPTTSFGKYVRQQRLVRLSGNPDFSLRRVALSCGLEPSFLSKIERGIAQPPSEQKIKALADALAETIRMFLAIHKAGLPIVIANPEAVRKRVLGQDNLGIIPEYDSPHRANQSFAKEQCVYDVIYFRTFGRFKKRIVPFITWEPLPLLR